MHRPSLWDRLTSRSGSRDSVRKAILRGASWSGKEPNHFFLNLEGAQFKDVSAVAGLDDIADGRSFAIFDYDRDGWLDFAVTNKNEPRIELFRNGIGRLSDHGIVAVRFVGGNRTDKASEWSNRNGYGAQLTLELGDRRIVREHRCGEGFAAQNSATLVVGVGRAESVDRVTVRWPSGRTSKIGLIRPGTLLTVYENPADSPTGQPFVAAPYAPERTIAPPRPAVDEATTATLRLAAMSDPPQSRLRLVTTLATWCLPCRNEVPVLSSLRQRFSAADLDLLGVAIDPDDGPDALAEWNAELEPPYRILDVTDEERTAVQQLVAEQLGSEGVPASLVVDSNGRLVHAQWGPPTVSTLRRLLDGAPEAEQLGAP